jgi:bifunctional non-homologous end joining protein LigD
LCGVGPNGTTSFNIVQLASDSDNAAALVFFLFDLLYLDGDDFRPRPLIERKERLSALLLNAAPCLHTSDYVGPIGALIEEIRFAADSPLEEAVTSELVSGRPKIPC